MKRWEYLSVARQIVIDDGKGELVRGLDEYGDQGWELITIERHPGKPDWDAFIFKREHAA